MAQVYITLLEKLDWNDLRKKTDAPYTLENILSDSDWYNKMKSKLIHKINGI